MNYNISIVDDEATQRALISKLVLQWEKKTNNNLTTKTYDSAESFLFDYGIDSTVDIMLLDIQMKTMDGVALAKQIRKDNEHVQIIFITGIPDFIAEGYEVSALHYLMKPVNVDKLFEVLDRAASKMQAVTRTIIFSRGTENVRIKADDILYAEISSHNITLHLKKGEEIFPMRISDMESQLGDGFFRCHRSFIVSMLHLRSVTKTAMLLENGEKVPLSRKLYDEANQAFIKFNYESGQ